MFIIEPDIFERWGSLTTMMPDIYTNKKVYMDKQNNGSQYVIVNGRLIKPIFPKENMVGEPKNKYIGSTFTLVGSECDDFTMPKRKYEIVHEIKKIDDIDINSFVVKQVSGDNSHAIFTLTKSDCKSLGIPYERGLHLLPNNMDFEMENVKSEPIFNEYDLSTYPLSYDDKVSVKFMKVKISGFEGMMKFRRYDGVLNDVRKIIVRCKKDIPSNGDFASFKRGEKIDSVLSHAHNKSAIIELNFSKYINDSVHERGINPSSIVGTFDEYFSVTLVI